MLDFAPSYLIGAGGAFVCAMAALTYGLTKYMMGVSTLMNGSDRALSKSDVAGAVDSYAGLFDKKTGGVKQRKGNYMDMVNKYYSLVTDMYLFAWGEQFHFADRFATESFEASLLRAEQYLALALGLRGQDQRCLDVGCGVGGPARNIAKFTGSHIVGVNNSEYQLRLANRFARRDGLAHQLDFVQSDFMKLNDCEGIEAGSFDAAYQIEATCHAPDKVGCYRQVFDTLKPGAKFAGYEWCVTPRYDASNQAHRDVKLGIERGNGLPDLATFDEVVEALEAAGFRVVEARDVHQHLADSLEGRAAAVPARVPWYQPLDGGDGWSLTGFARTKLGGLLTHLFISLLECCGVSPAGLRQMSDILRGTQTDLILGGKQAIFTPTFFFLAEKPLEASGQAAGSVAAAASSTLRRRN